MKWLKHILFFAVMLLLLFPLIQQNFALIKAEKSMFLVGSFSKANNTAFTQKNWFSGEYQLKKEKYLNENFGFRVLAVRAHNQIAFSLFNKTNTQSIIVGKNEYLYETEYINAYYGNDFVGFNKVEEHVRKLKFVQDTLDKLGKTLVVVYTAGKGSFYPEFFPETYIQNTQKTSNYEAYTNASKKNGLHFIDFNAFFLNNKNKTKYSLYPQHGIHWSEYGGALVCDSMIKFIERERQTELLDFKIKEILEDYEKDIDYDLGAGLNLLIQFKRQKMGYATTEIENNSKKQKPRLLTIGDSFYYTLLNNKFSKCFSNHQFWYYNKSIIGDSTYNKKNTSEINFQEEINQHDIFILLASERNLNDFGWGFIEKMYDFYIHH